MTCLLKYLPEEQKNSQNRVSLYYFGRAPKITLVELNKRSAKFSKFFVSKNRPLLKKYLRTPLNIRNQSVK